MGCGLVARVSHFVTFLYALIHNAWQQFIFYEGGGAL
jgi:hypothetical protein